MLTPLADNGGPTLTHALLPGSPAIDTGLASATMIWDQRGDGFPRTNGSAPDIGAFESPVADQPPTAVDDSFATNENTLLNVGAPGLLGNDSDPDGDTLSAVLVSDVGNGTLTLGPDGSFSYVPQPNFLGTDTFTYQVTDGQVISNIATVTIEVLEVIDDEVFANGFDSAG
jgi:hypothetical protein